MPKMKMHHKNKLFNGVNGRGGQKDFRRENYDKLGEAENPGMEESHCEQKEKGKMKEKMGQGPLDFSFKNLRFSLKIEK